MATRLRFTGKSSQLQAIALPRFGAVGEGEIVEVEDEDQAKVWVKNGNFEYVGDDEELKDGTVIRSVIGSYTLGEGVQGTQDLDKADLMKLKREELADLATDLNVTFDDKAKKEELADAILAAREVAAVVVTGTESTDEEALKAAKEREKELAAADDADATSEENK
jgi:hypothetical protein